VNLTTLLKKAFDYEHWVDPGLQIRAVKELGLEHIWPISATCADAEPEPREPQRAASFWRSRAANTQR
jgi:hypothetical protein